MNLVGRHVRQIRMTRDEKMSQADLAARCQRAEWDVTREIIAKIEGGTRKVSDLEAKCLAGVLGVPIAQLYGD